MNHYVNFYFYIFAAFALTFPGCGNSDSTDGILDAGVPNGDINDTGGGRTEDCDTPDEPGPSAVGIKDINLDDPLRDGELDVHILYPATSDGPDAPQDNSRAPYPLVVFSHGFMMYPAIYDYLLSHLASHGFVVIGTKHQDSADHVIEALAKRCRQTPLLEQILRAPEMFGAIFETDHPLRRPGDVSTLIDASIVLNQSDPTLAGMIDTAKIGVMGHSFGGFTSMAVAGAEVIKESVTNACAGNPGFAAMATDSLRVLICALFDTVDEARMQAPLELDDERVMAVVNIAGPVKTIWGVDFEGLSNQKNPALMIYTNTDDAVVFNQGVEKAYEALPTPKYFLVLKGGNHGNFGKIDYKHFNTLSNQIPGTCLYNLVVDTMVGSPGQQPRLAIEDQHRLTKTGAVAFFNRHLAGNEACSAYLKKDFFFELGGDLEEFESAQ